MELLMTLLVGILFSTMLGCAFYLGYKYRDSKPDNDAVEINDENKEQFKQIMDWLNYRR